MCVKERGRQLLHKSLSSVKNIQQTSDSRHCFSTPPPPYFNQKHVLQHLQVYLIRKISNVIDLLKVIQTIFKLNRLIMKYENTGLNFYDRMAVHRNRFLVNKTNRHTDFQFLLVLLFYMSQAAFLPIIRSS